MYHLFHNSLELTIKLWLSTFNDNLFSYSFPMSVPNAGVTENVNEW